MGKNEFDIDFDFDEDYTFDPNAFLGTEEYDDKLDLEDFSDEELGLTPRKKASHAAEEDFDLDDDLNLDEFLNMGNHNNTAREEAPATRYWSNKEAEPDLNVSDEGFEEASELSEDDESEEIAMNDNMEYEDELEMQETSEYEEEYEEDEDYEESETDYDEEQDEDEDDSDEDTGRTRTPFHLPKINLPKIKLPKIKLKVPNIFTKFFDLYFAPVLHKEKVQGSDFQRGFSAAYHCLRIHDSGPDLPDRLCFQRHQAEADRKREGTDAA